VIVSEQYGDGTKTPHPAISGGLATSIPLVVLVNGNTASASEIVLARSRTMGAASWWVDHLRQRYGAKLFSTFRWWMARITIASVADPNGTPSIRKV